MLLTPAKDAADEVNIYVHGPVYLSACTSLENRELLAERVNALIPTGVGPWQIADEPFSGGQPNPCPCVDNPARQHFLFSC